jgi:DNA-binding transcriptional regulator YdaS (Cro superfamily)
MPSSSVRTAGSSGNRPAIDSALGGDISPARTRAAINDHVAVSSSDGGGERGSTS